MKRDTGPSSASTEVSKEITTPLAIVGIGASAGGLEALREVFSAAVPPTGLAFVVVQHLDPHHESMMAQLLDRHTDLRVLQCEGGEAVEADTVYIIPPGHGLRIKDGKLELTEFPQPRGLRRPIDDFFASLAEDKSGNAACVILSGTGADGTTGLRAIKEHGGLAVVQEPATAKYDGMPLSAVGTGLVDFVREPADIIACLASFFGRRVRGDTEVHANFVAENIDELCKVLQASVGHDFSGYKRTTLARRIERRMHVLGIDRGTDYLARVRKDGNECEALFRDLLINVTRFFRDGELFDLLSKHVIRPLVQNAAGDDEIRVWVPGCSSGEEAYSIAMVFAEEAHELGMAARVHIFATDIDEQMLQIAREGSYPISALNDIPHPMRERFTVPHTDHFTMSAAIRDMVRFSNHSVVKDPPFSRIDLVSCRNLLIYFNDRLQQTVLPLLHYAIRPGGFLFLGPSESIGRFENLFSTIDQTARIFERAPGSAVYPLNLPGNHRGIRIHRATGAGDERRSTLDDGAAVNRLIERYVPPSLVLDSDGLIMGAYGKLARFFEFPVSRLGGSSAISLARPGLRKILGPLMRQARDTKRRVTATAVEVRSEFGTLPVEVVCEPLPDNTLLFVFLENGPFRPESGQLDQLEIDSGDDQLDALESELRLTRHRLRSTVEELETANEELKSSNEEMMSMNEELQSTNEELSTVNDELKSKVEQLTVANSDLRNFFESTSLVNAYVDFGDGPLKPYVGGGIGAAHVDFRNHGVVVPAGIGLPVGPLTAMDDSGTGFAWQVGAGVSYDLTSNLTAELGYRYFNVENVGLTAADGTGSDVDLRSHQVNLGLRIRF